MVYMKIRKFSRQLNFLRSVQS